MNPAALRANVGVAAQGGHAARQRRRLRRAQPGQGRLRRQPAHRRVARRVHGLRGADDLDHPGGLQGGRGQAPRRRAVEELLRPRPGQLALHPADRTDHRVDRQAVRRAGRRWPRPTPGPSGPASTSARRPSCSRPTTRSAPAAFEKGEYIQVTGNQALAWGLIAAARLAGLPLFLGSYPITPASDILHELSRRKEFGVRTFQAEDEIAGVGAALGAAFGGSLGVTTTSGPGLDLKSETIGLAINLELPLLIVDVQRGGPSTGLPTKTEQADLLHAMYGRHGEAPLPIIAAKTPSHCFEVAIEAVRIAVKYRTPVILLSDGYLANGAEPWRLPDLDDAAAPIDPGFATEPNHVDDDGTATFWPYVRDRETLARPWAPPGVPGPRAPHRRPREGRRHRQRLLRPGQPRADGPAAGGQDRRHRPGHPAARGRRRGRRADVLVLGWGSTYGAIAAGVAAGPGPGPQGRPGPPGPPEPVPAPTWARCSRRYREVLVPEMNLGQLSRLVRAEFLVDAQSLNKMQGVPFRAGRDRDRHREPARRHLMTTAIPVTTRKDWTSDQEVRWCPGCGDYSILAAVQMLLPDLGRPPGEHRVPLGHRLRGPLPVLHEHLRDALDPRPGAGHRHRAGHHPPRPRRLGGHRRRRRALHRRQPPHPRPAAQRPDDHPDVQQPDLRADQGPVLADLGGGQGHQVDAVRLGRHAVQPGQPGPRGRGDASWPAPTTWTAPTCRRPSAGPTSTTARPSSRCTRTATSSTTAPSRRSPARDARSSMLIPLVHGEPIRFGAEGERGVVQRPDGRLEIVDVAEVGEDALLVHDEARDDPGPGLRPVPPVARPLRADADRRVPGRRAARVRRRDVPPDRPTPRSSGAWVTSRPCCGPARAGRSTEPLPVSPPASGRPSRCGASG